MIAELGPSVSDKNYKDNLLFLKAVDEVEQMLKQAEYKKLSKSKSQSVFYNAYDVVGSGLSYQGEHQQNYPQPPRLRTVKETNHENRKTAE